MFKFSNFFLWCLEKFVIIPGMWSEMIEHQKKRLFHFVVFFNNFDGFVGEQICRVTSRFDVVIHINSFSEIVTRSVRWLNVCVVIVINQPVVITVEGIEAAVSWCVFSIEESQMPKLKDESNFSAKS